MNNKKVNNKLFSCIEIADDDYFQKYKFNQDLWNYDEFRRLKDIRKYINSIKKDLIGKTLDKVLFLNDLNNNIYIFKDDMWQGYDEETKQMGIAYEPYWEDVAPSPVVLVFGGNRLEIDVSKDAKRCFDGPDYVRLGFNTIKDLDKIEKRFKGINHSVRFKNIIGQKLSEIITETKCNHIEFKFENGYGCRIYTDTCADYGTEFSVITPKDYAHIPHRVCAYKETRTSDWTMEILTGEQTNDKFIEEYYRNKFTFWKNPISMNFEKDMIEKRKGNLSNLVLELLNYDGCGYNDWIYIGDTDKFYYKTDVIPEPSTKSKKSSIKVNFNIDYEGAKNYLENLINKDYLEYDVYNAFELIASTKSFKLNISYGTELRSNITKFIKDIENNNPSSLRSWHTQQDIIFAYPKDNELRIVVRSSLFKGAKYIFDYTTNKDDYIKQLKNGVYELKKIQYSVNKRIREYMKENNIKRDKEVK